MGQEKKPKIVQIGNTSQKKPRKKEEERGFTHCCGEPGEDGCCCGEV